MVVVVVASARRISELWALSVRRELCVFHKGPVVLRTGPSFIPKVNSAYNLNQELVLLSFCPKPSPLREKEWHKLDVCRVLHIYIKRTAQLRLTDSLFISHSTANLGRKVLKTLWSSFSTIIRH